MAEKKIRAGQVTFKGEVIYAPHMLVNIDEITSASAKKTPLIKLSGKPVLFHHHPLSLEETTTTTNKPKAFGFPTTQVRVWAVHKVRGEVVTENDPLSRPSMMERLRRSGVGDTKKGKVHLKPIGRLDLSSEGLMLVTNDGHFARVMEKPSSKMHRVYRARVFGNLSSYKLNRIRRGGIEYDNVRYPRMKVEVEKTKKSRGSVSSKNIWVRVTCTEGKNRQIKNVFKALGLSLSRLIRIQYGDYKLDKIPPGIAIPVTYEDVTNQKARGTLYRCKGKIEKKNDFASPVKWVNCI